MNKLFKIILMVDDKEVLMYDWGSIPVVGDVISISNGNVFHVKKRLLSSDSHEVDGVLFFVVALDGVIENSRK